MGSIPESGRSPGEGNGYPLQCSCLSSMDRGGWWTTVHRVTKESDMTEWLSVCTCTCTTHTHTHIFPLRDNREAPVSTKKKKKLLPAEDSTNAKCSFHCSTLPHYLRPLILGSVFLPQLHQASQFQCFLWQTGIGRPVSVFASTDHYVNEKYLHAAGSETHDSWLQCRKCCLQGCWLQLDIKPIISSLAVWT